MTYFRGHWSLDPFLFAARAPLELPNLYVADHLLASSPPVKQRSTAVGTTATVASDGPLSCRSCTSACLIGPLRLARPCSRLLPSPRSEHPTRSRSAFVHVHLIRSAPLPLSYCCGLRASLCIIRQLIGPIICSKRKRLRGRSRSAQSHPPGGYSTAESGVLPQALRALRPHRTVAPPS